MSYQKRPLWLNFLVWGVLILVSGCQPIQPGRQPSAGKQSVTTIATQAPATPMPTAMSPAATKIVPETPLATESNAAVISATIEIKLFKFQTPRLEIPVGTTVVWKNKDDIQHSATAGTPDNPGGLFDSDFFTLDQEFSFTFTKPGEYPYFCKRHKHMQGVIVVTE